MDGFCLQGELDLTFILDKIERGFEGFFENRNHLMTLMTVTLMTGPLGIEK